VFINDIGNIIDFIFARLCKIHDEILPHDRKYCELGEKPEGILRRLNDSLTPEQWRLFNEYDIAQNLQMNRQDEVVYSWGLVDGIYLSYWVDRVRREPEQVLSELGFDMKMGEKG